VKKPLPQFSFPLSALSLVLCAVLFVLWHLFLAVSMITGWLSDQCQNLLHDLGEVGAAGPKDFTGGKET
jgi:hypothetical protein